MPEISAPRLTPTRRTVIPAWCETTGRATLGFRRSDMANLQDFVALSAAGVVRAILSNTVAGSRCFWQPACTKYDRQSRLGVWEDKNVTINIRNLLASAMLALAMSGAPAAAQEKP